MKHFIWLFFDTFYAIICGALSLKSLNLTIQQTGLSIILFLLYFRLNTLIRYFDREENEPELYEPEAIDRDFSLRDNN